ncbi:MAG: preprotein translocase subunit YajC [Acidaminobacteraceae bacterium]
MGLAGTAVYLVAFMGIFYFLLIRPQKKKSQELSKLRESLVVGDDVITIGGIKGRVRGISDEDITLEVGSDNTLLVVKKWAIHSVGKQD